MCHSIPETCSLAPVVLLVALALSTSISNSRSIYIHLIEISCDDKTCFFNKSYRIFSKFYWRGKTNHGVNSLINFCASYLSCRVVRSAISNCRNKRHALFEAFAESIFIAFRVLVVNKNTSPSSRGLSFLFLISW